VVDERAGRRTVERAKQIAEYAAAMPNRQRLDDTATGGGCRAFVGWNRKGRMGVRFDAGLRARFGVRSHGVGLADMTDHAHHPDGMRGRFRLPLGDRFVDMRGLKGGSL
jgi:hypothetical protein